MKCTHRNVPKSKNPLMLCRHSVRTARSSVPQAQHHPNPIVQLHPRRQVRRREPYIPPWVLAMPDAAQQIKNREAQNALCLRPTSPCLTPYLGNSPGPNKWPQRLANIHLTVPTCQYKNPQISGKLPAAYHRTVSHTPTTCRHRNRPPPLNHTLTTNPKPLITQSLSSS